MPLTPPPLDPALALSIWHSTNKTEAKFYNFHFLQCYVQDLLKSDSESVCETIMLNGGHIYVCGDVSMASDVSNTLQTMLQEYAALSIIEATSFISKLRVSFCLFYFHNLLTQFY